MASQLETAFQVSLVVDAGLVATGNDILGTFSDEGFPKPVRFCAALVLMGRVARE